jgi:hypothetical protein
MGVMSIGIREIFESCLIVAYTPWGFLDLHQTP